jgi:hypothetical protein
MHVSIFAAEWIVESHVASGEAYWGGTGYVPPLKIQANFVRIL